MSKANEESKLQESQVINEARTKLNDKILSRAKSQTIGPMIHLANPEQKSQFRKHSQRSQRISMLASRFVEKQSLLGSNLQSQIMYKKSIDVLQTSFMYDALNRRRLRAEKEKRVDVLKMIQKEDQKNQILFIDQFSIVPQFKKLKIRIIDFENKLDPEVGKLKRKIQEQKETIETNHERTFIFGNDPQRRVPIFRKNKPKETPIADIDLDNNKDNLKNILNESQSPSPSPKPQQKRNQNDDDQDMTNSVLQKQLKNNLISQIEDLVQSQTFDKNKKELQNPPSLTFSQDKKVQDNEIFLNSEKKYENNVEDSNQKISVTEDDQSRKNSNKIMELAKRMSQKDSVPISQEKIETGVNIEELQNKFKPKEKQEVQLIDHKGKIIYDNTKPKNENEQKKDKKQNTPKKEKKEDDVSLDFLQNQATPLGSKSKAVFNPLITIQEEQEDFYPTMIDFTRGKRGNQKTSDDLFKFQANSDTIKTSEGNSKRTINDGKSKGSDNINEHLDKILKGENPTNTKKQDNSDQQYNVSDVSQINDSNLNSVNPDSMNFSKKLKPSQILKISSEKNTDEQEKLRKSKTLQPDNHKFNYTIDETLSALEQSEIQKEEEMKRQKQKDINKNKRQTLPAEDKLLFQKSQTSNDSYFDNMMSSNSEIKPKKNVTLNINKNYDKRDSEDTQLRRRPNLQNLFDGEQSNRLLVSNKSVALSENSQSVNSQVVFLDTQNLDDQKFQESFALSDDQSQYVPLKRKYAVPDTQNHAIHQLEVKKTLFVTGNCCFLFLVSSILWILLCKDLIKKANHISGVILQTNNLEEYHTVYTQFFNKYNENRLKQIETQQIFEQNSIDEYTRFKKTLQEFINNQNTMNEDLFEIKKYLYNQKKAFSRRRILEEGGHTHQDQLIYDENNMKLKYKQQGAIYALKKVRLIKAKLEVLQKILHYIKLNKQVLGTIYQDILENVNELYENSFQLITYYGKFHAITNKIQAFKEDIYHLNERRMFQILKQIEISHFEKVSARAQNFKLEQMNYYAPALVSYLPSIEFEEKTPVSLLCSVDIEINNQHLDSLNKSFDMFLVKNNETSEDQDFLFFENKIKKQHQSFYFNQILEFPAGKNNLSLYAYLQNGNIDVTSLQVDCLKFIEYEKIKEYEFQLIFVYNEKNLAFKINTRSILYMQRQKYILKQFQVIQ